MKNLYQTFFLFLFISLLNALNSKAQCVPTAPIIGPATVCLGTTINYTSNVVSMSSSSNTWTISGGGIVNPGGGPIGPAGVLISWASVGTYTITYRPTLFGCSTPPVGTLTVSVVNSPVPIAPTITGPSTFCTNSTATYSVPNVLGLTPQWYVVPFTGTPPTLLPSGNQVNITSTTDQFFQLFVSYSNGSCTGSQSIITVNSSSGTRPLSISSSSGNVGCLSTPTSLSAFTGDSNDTFNWSLVSGGALTPSGTNNNTASIQWNSQGTFFVTVTATNPCNATPRNSSISITVGPSLGAVGSISSQNTTLCYKSPQTFSVAPVTNAQTYSWNFTPTVGSPWTVQTTIPSVTYTFNSGGQYTLNLIVSNASCNSSTTLLNFSVIGYAQNPLLSYSPNACINTNVPVSVTNNTSYTYSWSLGDGVINGASNTNSINAQWPTGGLKIISVTATSACDQITITSNTLAVPPPPPLPNQPYPINIQTSTVNLGSIITPANINQICLGSYYYGTTLPDLSVSSFNFSAIPQSSATITGTQVTWLTSGTNTLVLTASNSCGGTTQKSISVQVNSGTKPIGYYPNNGSTDFKCIGNLGNYSIPNTSGYTYLWSLSDPTGGTMQSPSIVNSNFVQPILWTKASAPYYLLNVKASNGSCDGEVLGSYIGVSPIPSMTSTLSPPSICSNTIFNYIPTSSESGATFSWSRASVAGVSQSSYSGTGSISEQLTNTTDVPLNVTYVITTTANNCIGIPQNISVTVNPIPVFSSSLLHTSICTGSTFNYIPTSVVSGAIFSWTRDAVTGISDPPSSGIGSINEILTNTTNAGIVVTYALTATANGCSRTEYISVSVFPIPNLSSDLSPSFICSPNFFTYFESSSIIGASFSWSRNQITGISQASSSGTGHISEYLTNTTSAPIDVTYSITSMANGCTAIQNKIVKVNPTPTLSSSLLPPNLCSSNFFNYILTSEVSGATFSWNRGLIFGISQAASSGTGNISEVLTNTTSAAINVTYVIITTANGCSGSPQNVVVSVKPTPILSSTLSPAAICSGTTFAYTSTSAVAGSTFAWNRAAVAGISQVASSGTGNISEVLINTTSVAINVKYVVTTTASGCKKAQNVVVAVKPIPSLSSTLSPAAICSGTALSYTPTSAVAGSTFAWSRAAVGGISQAPSSGTGSISQVLTNTTSAAINVTYIVTTTANGCSSSAQNVVVSVKPTPTLSSTLSPTAICSSATFAYTPTSAVTGSTFAWSRAIITGISQAASSGTGNISEVLTNTTSAAINVTYAITTSSTGCSSVQNVVVSVNPLPAPVISGSTSVNLNSNGNIYQTPSVSGDTYLWTITGGTIASGAGTNSISVTWGAAGAGTLTLKETKPTGCFFTTSVYNVTINKLVPTISFTSPTSFVYGSGLTLSVNKGGSTGAVTYSVVNGTGSAYIDQQNSTLWSQGAGSVTVTASAASDMNYSAGSVSQIFTINKADPFISFTSPRFGTYNTTINLTIGGLGSTGVVTYSVTNDSGTATISGSTLSLTGGGRVTVTANLAPNINFNAGSASMVINIEKADQTITSFTQPPTKTYGDAPFQFIATSSSGLPVTFFSDNINVAAISGNIATITGAGTTNIYASQPGNSNYNATSLGGIGKILTVQKANQLITFNPLPTKNCGDAQFGMTASSNAGLPITFESSSYGIASIHGINRDQLMINGNGSCSITAQSIGDYNYNPASTSQTFTVSLPVTILSNGVLCMDGRQTLTASINLTPGIAQNPTFAWGNPGCCIGYSPSFTAFQSGDYTVRVNYSANGQLNICNGTVSYTIPDAYTQCGGGRIASKDEPSQGDSKTEEPSVEEITVFPNPAVNQFTVALPERVKEDTPLAFYDLMGKQLISSTIPKGQWKVSVSVENISEGMYLVKIGYGDYGTVKKVMVKR
ncbi:MAG: PKD-like domain-containing protein [Cyclobacteriaceae bacterium]